MAKIVNKKIIARDEIKRINEAAKGILKNGSRDYKTIIEKHKKAWKELANR